MEEKNEEKKESTRSNTSRALLFRPLNLKANSTKQNNGHPIPFYKSLSVNSVCFLALAISSI